MRIQDIVPSINHITSNCILNTYDYRSPIPPVMNPMNSPSPSRVHTNPLADVDVEVNDESGDGSKHNSGENEQNETQDNSTEVVEHLVIQHSNNDDGDVVTTTTTTVITTTAPATVYTTTAVGGQDDKLIDQHLEEFNTHADQELYNAQDDVQTDGQADQDIHTGQNDEIQQDLKQDDDSNIAENEGEGLQTQSPSDSLKDEEQEQIVYYNQDHQVHGGTKSIENSDQVQQIEAEDQEFHDCVDSEENDQASENSEQISNEGPPSESKDTSEPTSIKHEDEPIEQVVQEIDQNELTNESYNVSIEKVEVTESKP